MALVAALVVAVVVSIAAYVSRRNGLDARALPTASAPDTAWLRESEQWRAERQESLRDPEGWFSLVGLFWLEEGENSFGSAKGNAIRLPADRAPAQGGTIVRRGTSAEIRVREGVPVTSDGQPVHRLALASDAEGSTPTMLALGSLRFHLIRRGDRLGVRVKDRASPALAAFHGVENYPLNRRWKTSARFDPYDPPKEIEVPNVTGDVNKEKSPGALVFVRDGVEHRVDVLAEPGDDEYWVIFADRTTGRGTYGGGRFLYVPVAGANGRTTIDFNRAYNPPCAFTPYATCPLPPKQNRLALAVEAGERDYGGAH